MVAVTTTLLVGSVALPQQEFNVNGEGVTIPAGTYYYRHPNAAVSLIDVIATEVVAQTTVASAQVELMRSLRTRLTFNFAATLVWGSATLLRDLLGFTGNGGALTEHVSQERSRYIYSPGRPATLPTRSGVAGYPVEDANIVPSADGTEQDTDFHVTHTWQDLAWDSVPASRVRASASQWGGNTWHRFRQHVMVPGYRFHVYELIVEDLDSVSDVVIWSDPLTETGQTYKVREIPPGKFRRKIDNANTYWAFGAKLRVVNDISSPS